jgi:hypothetical protein
VETDEHGEGIGSRHLRPPVPQSTGQTCPETASRRTGKPEVTWVVAGLLSNLSYRDFAQL